MVSHEIGNFLSGKGHHQWDNMSTYILGKYFHQLQIRYMVNIKYIYIYIIKKLDINKIHNPIQTD